MHRLFAIATIVVMVISACGSSQSSAPATTLAPAGSPPPQASLAAAFGPRPTRPPLIEECRRTIFMHPEGGPRLTDQERRDLQIALQYEDRGAVFALFTTGSRDLTCVASYIQGFSSLSTYSWGAPFPSLLAPGKPLVVGPTGGDSGLGVGDAWGAIAPEVARVTITDAAGQSADAVIQGRYFLGLLHTKSCCIFTIVAYDAAGNELARSR